MYTIGWYRRELALVFRDEGGKRHRHSLGTADKSEAEKLAPALYVELTKPKGDTVGVLWASYVKAYSDRAVAETMSYTWKSIAHRFGSLRPDQITPELCEEHIAQRRAAGRAEWTIYTELSHLRSVLLWAVKRKLISEAPHIVRPMQPKAEEAKHFTRAEVRRLIAAADLDHVKLALVLFYTTAGRKTALLGLTWDRVDFTNNRIDLRDPTLKRPHKGRAIVPILKTARPYLLEAKDRALSNYVIEWAGDPIKSMRRSLARAGELAGLPRKVTPHLLRHSAAVHMAEDRVDMEIIRQFLGHRSIDTTRRIYARYSPGFLADAARALEI